MAHSNYWEETVPAGSDLASTLDEVIRQLKTDLRERLILGHHWVATTGSDPLDGLHREIVIVPSLDGPALITDQGSGQILTGINSTPMIEFHSTWNTTGSPTLLRFHLTKMACNTDSRLFDIVVNSASLFWVSLTGVVTAAGFVGPLTGTVTDGLVSTGRYANPVWLTSLSGSKLTEISGTVMMTASASVASGWFACDGASKIRADLPELFAAIGTTYGSVDGTHFNLPNLSAPFTNGKYIIKS